MEKMLWLIEHIKSALWGLFLMAWRGGPRRSLRWTKRQCKSPLAHPQGRNSSFLRMKMWSLLLGPSLYSDPHRACPPWRPHPRQALRPTLSTPSLDLQAGLKPHALWGQNPWQERPPNQEQNPTASLWAPGRGATQCWGSCAMYPGSLGTCSPTRYWARAPVPSSSASATTISTQTTSTSGCRPWGRATPCGSWWTWKILSGPSRSWLRCASRPAAPWSWPGAPRRPGGAWRPTRPASRSWPISWWRSWSRTLFPGWLNVWPLSDQSTKQTVRPSWLLLGLWNSS